MVCVCGDICRKIYVCVYVSVCMGVCWGAGQLYSVSLSQTVRLPTLEAISHRDPHNSAALCNVSAHVGVRVCWSMWVRVLAKLPFAFYFLVFRGYVLWADKRISRM